MIRAADGKYSAQRRIELSLRPAIVARQVASRIAGALRTAPVNKRDFLFAFSPLRSIKDELGSFAAH